MNCPVCGAPLDGTMGFCPNCGTPVSNNNNQQQSFQQQPDYEQQNYQQQYYQQQNYQQQYYQQQNYHQQQQQYYQQQYYQSPYHNPLPYGAPVPGKGLAIASLLFGLLAIIGIVVSVFLYIEGLDSWFDDNMEEVIIFLIVSAISAVLGIIFGAVGNSKARAVGRHHGMATAGIACSVIALSLALVGGVIAFVLDNAGTLFWNSIF